MPEVHFIGEIHSAIGFPTTNALFCKWYIVPTPPLSILDKNDPVNSAHTVVHTHWRLMNNNQLNVGFSSGGSRIQREQNGSRCSGTTWTTECNREYGKYARWIWNEAIDVGFTCSSTSGWPMLIVEVYEKDEWDRAEIAGYGGLRMPISRGYNQRRIVISRPRGTSWQHWRASFIGERPRYSAPAAVLSSGDSRYGHSTISVGHVDVRINVVLRGFDNMPIVQLGKNITPSTSSDVCNGCFPTLAQFEAKQTTEISYVGNTDEEEYSKNDMKQESKLRRRISRQRSQEERSESHNFALQEKQPLLSQGKSSEMEPEPLQR
jgi:hypothetical protein